MDNSILILIVLGLFVIVLVMIYNAYQESQYRKKIKAQFGHADKDALMDVSVANVRDGEKGVLQLHPKARTDKKTFFSTKDTVESEKPSPEDVTADDSPTEKPEDVFIDTPLPNAEFSEQDLLLQGEGQDNVLFEFESVVLSPIEHVAVDQKLLLDLNDLAHIELPWFNHQFDYMAYVSLQEARELHNLPRLSNKHRFRMAACTLDGQFQLAEPIPGLYYQGFVIGLQAISRRGLATTQELEQFGDHVNEFAKDMGGALKLSDVAQFLNMARPLDELCARVDQIIGIHLVSRETVPGIELKTALEDLNFELSHDGAFYYPDMMDPYYQAVPLDGSSFTQALLATQQYKGFSMLFDITHVPAGEKYFNQFMELSVKLSSTLGMDLMDDKLEELSTQWLRKIGDYVLARQEEMKAVGIAPGGELAKRLFT